MLANLFIRKACGTLSNTFVKVMTAAGPLIIISGAPSMLCMACTAMSYMAGSLSEACCFLCSNESIFSVGS